MQRRTIPIQGAVAGLRSVAGWSPPVVAFAAREVASGWRRISFRRHLLARTCERVNGPVDAAKAIDRLRPLAADLRARGEAVHLRGALEDERRESDIVKGARDLFHLPDPPVRFAGHRGDGI